MSLEQNDVHQAIICYKKAIDADVKCIKFHWQRCSLLEQVAEKTKALLGYRRLLNGTYLILLIDRIGGTNRLFFIPKNAQTAQTKQNHT